MDSQLMKRYPVCYGTPKDLRCVHKSLPLYLILSQLNPAYTPCLFNIHLPDHFFEIFGVNFGFEVFVPLCLLHFLPIPYAFRLV
jgi:hypothetical protein